MEHDWSANAVAVRDRNGNRMILHPEYEKPASFAMMTPDAGFGKAAECQAFKRLRAAA
ncbi:MULTISPECIES: hypothetical protein [unclassified Caballeronia]|uniref:hypothetical protein n=1 Tax=unclassified Caballeronia TaxID=2646786 RepID=UPI0020282720|nr:MULTISPECIES: hypothetical protein [unclassified Caballeronia]